MEFDRNNIPILSRNDIEISVENLLKEIDEKTNGKSRNKSMRELLEFIASRAGVAIGYQDLTEFGEAIIGLTDFKAKKILIEAKLAGKKEFEPIFNFTCGHQIGHWILHSLRPIRITAGEDEKLKVNDQIVCIDNYTRIATQEKLSPGNLLEWQANAFASSLLFPKTQLELLILRWQIDKGIRNPGQIYLDNQPVNQRDFFELSNYLNTRYFKAPLQALKIRMKELNILEEKGLKLPDILESLKIPRE